MTTRQAARQAAELNTDSPCVVDTAAWLGCSKADALAIERVETLLMAEDLETPRRRVIEANLLRATRRADRRSARRAA